MKDLEGKKVYLRGTGNAARYNGDKIIEATIVKVARVFVTFVIDGRRNEEKMRFSGRSLRGECNFGYDVYATKKEIEDFNLSQFIAGKISDKYSYRSCYASLGVEKLKMLAEILDIDVNIVVSKKG